MRAVYLPPALLEIMSARAHAALASHVTLDHPGCGCAWSITLYTRSMVILATKAARVGRRAAERYDEC